MKATHTHKVLKHIQEADPSSQGRYVEELAAAIIRDMEADEIMADTHPTGNGTVCTGPNCKMCERVNINHLYDQ